MTSISLNSVSIEFPIYEMSSRSLKKQLVRISTGGMLSDNSRVVTVKALDNISFTLQAGDRIGLVGHNGAGKSTLLRTLAQIYEPTSGTIEVDGKVSALLDVMLGMEPESTGYENIVMRGLIQGMKRKEILQKQQEIAEFTELGDYLSVPVRTYSSGMRLRLAFSIATSVLSEIIVLDEVVGAGDASFMNKAGNRFSKLMREAEIVILASHSDNVIRQFCNKVICLNAGKITWMGSVEEGLNHYLGTSQTTKASAPNEATAT